MLFSKNGKIIQVQFAIHHHDEYTPFGFYPDEFINLTTEEIIDILTPKLAYFRMWNMDKFTYDDVTDVKVFLSCKSLYKVCLDLPGYKIVTATHAIVIKENPLHILANLV